MVNPRDLAGDTEEEEEDLQLVYQCGGTCSLSYASMLLGRGILTCGGRSPPPPPSPVSPTVTPSDQSGWGFTVKQGGRTAHEDSGAYRVTTSSLTFEVDTVTHAIQWLTSQCDAQITHAIILTDSMNLLQKVESGMGCPDWHTAMHSLRLQRLLWIYCPGHVGVSGNERADRLASTADITSGLQLGRAEVLRGLRNFLNMDRPEHHSNDHLKERGVEKGSGRHSTLQGRQRSVFNQANIGTVSRATLGRLLRDGTERVWAFPSATMPS